MTALHLPDNPSAPEACAPGQADPFAVRWREPGGTCPTSIRALLSLLNAFAEIEAAT